MSLPAAPTAAAIITMSSLSGSRVDLSWTAVVGADRYEVVVSHLGEGPGGSSLPVTSASETNIAGLELPQDVGLVAVRGCNGNGCGRFAN